MFRPWVLLVPLAPLAALVGCTGTVSGTALDAEAATITSAVVVVERTTDTTQGARAEGSARFLRVAAPATVDDALRAIGAALELPARGTCASVRGLAGEPADVAPIVELLDVGTVSFVANGVETRLLPRQLPDVTDVVSGIIYARAAEPVLLPAAAGYVVHVAGGPGMAPFEITAAAPDDPISVRIAGESGQGTVVATGPTIDLAWTVDAPDGPSHDASRDLVYVDVRPNAVRCVFGNVGHAALSTALLDETGTLIVHRLHREALRAPGIDSGEIRFDFARSVAYIRP
jgi:hypothetical protein